MAVLFGEELFKCECGGVSFIKEELSTFTKKDENKLKEYSFNLQYRCVNCNKTLPIDSMYGYSIVQ